MFGEYTWGAARQNRHRRAGVGDVNLWVARLHNLVSEHGCRPPRRRQCLDVLQVGQARVR